jgi:pimeloyl-ACP methyl ester carboxylesterase
MKLTFDRGGDGPRLLVLLHGLSATRHVWTNFIATGHWKGSWIAPDLRGHGASAHADDYSLDAHAADIAELVRDAGEWSEVVVLGHSMGGAIAIALASGAYGIAPAQVFGLGIKVAWNDDELAALRKMPAMPVKLFATRDEAIGRYLKVSGLSGLIARDSTNALAGVVETQDGWRLACDPATASVGAPPMKELVAAARAPIHLARGAADAMVSHGQLTVFDLRARDLPGGHNAMVENPDAVWDWIDETLK